MQDVLWRSVGPNILFFTIYIRLRDDVPALRLSIYSGIFMSVRGHVPIHTKPSISVGSIIYFDREIHYGKCLSIFIVRHR